jgi:hypothetical protein
MRFHALKSLLRERCGDGALPSEFSSDFDHEGGAFLNFEKISSLKDSVGFL